MNALLYVLNGLVGVLTVLKQVPATSAIAGEVLAIEQAVQNAITAAQAAAQQSDEAVDPSLLLPIAPVATDGIPDPQ